MKIPLIAKTVLIGGLVALAGIAGVLILTNNPKTMTLWNPDKTIIHTTTISQSPDDLGKPDKQFIEMMVTDLQESTEISNSYKSNGDVAKLVASISQTQTTQISQLKRLYRENYSKWYSNDPPAIIPELEVEKTPIEKDLFRKNMPHSAQELLHRMIHRAKMTRRLAFLAVDTAQSNELIPNQLEIDTDRASMIN
jgi:uncharacterized protein (DUF305 family)